METRVAQLKTDFNNISSIRSTVKNIFDTLKQRIEKLKSLYSDFIQNNDNQLFVFGLDSFRFQSKLIDLEYEDMMRLFLAINNRMYCEYFKLYKIIIAYIHENISDKKITEVIKVNNFPVYKDLEPFKEYKFETVLELHENILILLGSVMNNIENKENELLVYQKKRRIGLNIDNFVTSFNYDIIIMKEKVGVFLTYMEFFHILHTKYLKRFSNKIQLMYTHISNDIKFDESVEMNREKKKEILGEFTEGDIDEELLDSLKQSVDIDCSSDSTLSEGVLTPINFAQHGLDLLGNKMSNTFVEFCENPKIDVNDSMYTEFGKIDTSCQTLLNNNIQQHLLNIDKPLDPPKLPGVEQPPSILKGLVKKVIVGSKIKTLMKPPIAIPPPFVEPLPVVAVFPVIEEPLVIEDPQPIIPDSPVVEEPPVIEEPPIVEEPPVIEEPPIVADTPVVEEPPVIEEPPVVADTPVVEEPPVIVDSPVIEEPPVIVDSPVIEEPPIIVDSPVVEEPQPVIADSPVVEEPQPVIVDSPVVEEPQPVIVDPPVVEEPPVVADPPVN
jgi:hypothetical protein